MEIFLFFVWTLLVPSFLLLPGYGWTFYKVWVGTRFKLALLLVGLLIAAIVGFFIMGIGQYGVLLYKSDDTIFTWICISAGGMTIANFCFNESHWLLAMFYFKMAMNMPRIIKRNENDPVQSYSVLHNVGLVLNGIFPLA